jgi:hypothetical protein
MKRKGGKTRPVGSRARKRYAAERLGAALNTIVNMQRAVVSRRVYINGVCNASDELLVKDNNEEFVNTPGVLSEGICGRARDQQLLRRQWPRPWLWVVNERNKEYKFSVHKHTHKGTVKTRTEAGLRIL